MARRKKPANPLRIIFLLALVGGALYFNQVVVPATPPLFIPTITPTRAPASYLKDAQDLIDKGKINQAIEMYKLAAKSDPRNPSVYVTLARWQVLYGDYDGAMESVQNALLINSNHALAHAVRGWILGKQGNYLEGESELKTAVDLDPNSALAFAYWSELLKDKIEAGKEDFNTRDLASQYSKKAIELDSSLMEVRRARGLVLEVTGNYDLAIKEFEAAVQMDSNLADLHIALGRNYKAAQMYDKAFAEFNKAIALKPDDAEPYAELSRAYYTVGEFSKGAQLAEQAVAIKPTDPILQGLLGSQYYKQGDYNTALKSLRLAVKGGLTDDGQTVVGLALDKTVTTTNLYSRYGLALANVGQCGESLQISQEIMQTVPDDENSTYNAQVMIDLCRQQAENPADRTTSTPEGTPEAGAVKQPTLQATATPGK